MRRLVTTIGLALIYAFLIAPLVVIVVVSFGASAVFEFPPNALTLRWYREFIANDAMVSAFFRVSLPVASITAIGALGIGVPASVAVARMRFAGRDAVLSFLTLPLLVPQVLLGVALLLLAIMTGVRPSLVTLVIAHIVITLPYVVNTVAAGLHGVDPSFEEAAMNLGATRLGAFMRVTLPLIRGGVLAGGIFAFVMSFGDINLALFLNGPGAVTIPVYIFSSILFQAEPTIAAAAATQIALVAVLLVAIARTVGLGGKI